MNWFHGLFAAALLPGLLGGPCSAGDIELYLAKDGKLKETLGFKKGAVAFLAPPGPEWIIEPSGAWREIRSESKGQFSSKQLAALAQHLATQDFHALPGMQGCPTKRSDGIGYSHEYVVIAFGPKEARFNTEPGKSPADYLPKPGDPNAATWSRFIALELILDDLLQKSKSTKNDGHP